MMQSLSRILIGFIFMGLLHGGGSIAQTFKDTLDSIAEDLGNWNTQSARKKIIALRKNSPSDPVGKFHYAHLLYLEGQYAASLKVYDEIAPELLESPGISRLYQLTKSTEKALRSFDELQTPDGRFLIRYEGKDRLLLPYLIDVLEKADQALQADFNFVPPSPIIVEVYPTIDYLAAVSSLTQKDLETSGTIALCSDNRLMLTSPRGLGRGYGWRDTLAHEFVHYFITKVSKNSVPIWLHEGIAKFQETRWRDAPGHKLDPPQEDLLARSLQKDQLITFQEMHPSMALLPSQEAAALAFAEVHSTIRYLHELGGYAKIRGLLKNLSLGQSMDAALNQTYGFSLNGLWTRWLTRTKALGLKTYPGLVHIPLSFKRPGTEDEELEAQLMTISQKRVKDLTHLGELLRARDRPLAALKEYMKAMKLQGEGNPAIQNGAASALIDLDRPEEVPPLMKVVKTYYPTFMKTYLNLGKAYLKLRQWQSARIAYERVIGINPFHPEVHDALLRIYSELGMKEKAEQARSAKEIIEQ